MKTIHWILGVIILALLVLLFIIKPKGGAQASSLIVTPITHATAVLEWGDTVFYTDPVGGAKAFEGKPTANIILLTDIHADHLNADTLKSVSGGSIILAPQAVYDQLPEDLKVQTRVMNNNESINEQGYDITAIPMYNLPESPDSRHEKGRGNGYLIEKDGYRVYIAGDTSSTPEMRAMTDIDMAFVPMNMPYTMSVEEAADAVLEFKPKIVYPYHYREQNGLANVSKFKELVNTGNPNIEVRLLNWYQE